MAAKKKASTTKVTKTDPEEKRASSARSAAFDAEEAYARHREAAQYRGEGSFSFFKFEPGDNIFRIAFFPKYPDLPSYIRICSHSGKTDRGSYRSVLDMDFGLGKKSPAREHVITRLTEEDIALYTEKGDPARQLMAKLGGRIPDDLMKKRYKPLPDWRALVVGWKDGSPFLIDRPAALVDQILDREKEWPGLLSPLNGKLVKIVVTKNAANKNQYGELQVIGRTEDLDPEEVGKPIDLWARVKSMALGYKQKVKFVFTSYPECLERADMVPEDFGVPEAEIFKRED